MYLFSVVLCSSLCTLLSFLTAFNVCVFALDYNFDGYPDVIIGCPYANSNAGYAYVVFGGRTATRKNIDLSALSASEGFMISGAHSYDSAGFCVTGSSDSLGNGLLLVGTLLSDLVSLLKSALINFLHFSPTGAPTSNSYLGTTYMLSNTKTLPTTATARPTFNPTSMPSTSPTSRPSGNPTTYPSPHPSPAPTVPMIETNSFILN